MLNFSKYLTASYRRSHFTQEQSAPTRAMVTPSKDREAIMGTRATLPPERLGITLVTSMLLVISMNSVSFKPPLVTCTTIAVFLLVGPSSISLNTSVKNNFSVGNNSCRGQSACGYFDPVSIGDNSCNGYYACYNMYDEVGDNSWCVCLPEIAILLCLIRGCLIHHPCLFIP